MEIPRAPSPEVIREFNDRGTLWLLEDPANVRDLLALLDPALAARLDFTEAQRFNRSFIAADLQKQESDLIFRVPVGGTGEDVWVYVLIEHQSRPDLLMPLRLYLYMGQLWEIQRREWEDQRVPLGARRLSPVLPLVFYTGVDPWTEFPRLAELADGPPELHRFVPHWETLFLNLRETSPETLTRIGSALGWALRVLQAERQPLATFETVLREALTGLEGLSEEQAGQWARAAWYLFLLVFHRRSDTEYTQLERTVWDQVHRSKFRQAAEVTEMAMSMAEVVEARGEVRGEARGEARGEIKGLREAVTIVLSGKFGPLPAGVAAQIAAADPEALRIWLGNAGAAATLDDVGFSTRA